MPVIVTMLRAVNLGGDNRIKIEQLPAFHESLALGHPQSTIESGKVVFRVSEWNCAVIARHIGEAIACKLGFRPAVHLRTAAELAGVIARNPFFAKSDPSKLAVSIFDADFVAEIGENPIDFKYKAEQLPVHGGEL